MSEQSQATDKPEEEKSQAQLDYEAGIEHLNNREAAQAANAFHNALVGYEQEKNEAGIANALVKLGDICVERGDHDTALTHYERAYGICEQQSDPFSLFFLEKKKAQLLADTGRYDDAISLYLDILDEYTAQRNPQGSVDTLEILAKVYLKQGDKAKAGSSYRLAASIHQKYKHSRHAEKYLALANEVENS